MFSGNHGEDVKECYYYLDSTPTHSCMKALYKYPQNEYPYERLVSENGKRTKQDQEFELTDAGKCELNTLAFIISKQFGKIGKMRGKIAFVV